MRALTLLFTLLLLFSGQTLSAQTKKQYLRKAGEMVETKNYYAALIYYKTVADAWPEDIDVAFQTAEAARMYNSYLLSEKFYQRVIDNDSLRRYPQAALHLATTKRMLGQYDEAIALYRQYDEVRADKEHNCDEAIASCQFAIMARLHYLPMVLTPIEANTEYAEFAPLRLGDTLYFTSLRFPIQDQRAASDILVSRIYLASNDAFGQLLRGQMQEGERHIAHTAFTPDFGRMIFSICKNINDSEYTCELFAAQRIGDTWVTVQRLPESINQPGYNTSQPSYGVLPDGREGLFFASDMPGGRGGMDIWFAPMDADGHWGAPENIQAVNTVADEVSPHFHSHSQRLFFSSTGYPNLGGFDIYESYYREGQWTSPAHLPIPFNSSFNDLYFSMTEDGEFMYLASNRETPSTKYIDADLQTCCNDIFRATYTRPVRLIARAFQTLDGSALPGASFRLERRSGPEWVTVDTKVDPSASTQEFPLAPGQDYRIIASKLGFLPDTASFQTLDWAQPDSIVQDLFMKQRDIRLEVNTFDKVTRAPLPSSRVRIYDITDPGKPRLVDESELDGSNQFTFGVRPGRRYEVRGSADGYMDALATVSAEGVGEKDTLRQDLYLRYKTLEEYLPLAVYFDNDLPGRRSRSTTTTVSYVETYQDYLIREDEYADIYSSILTDQEQSLLRGQIRDFFRDEVRNGMRELDNFCAALLRDLQRGNRVKVTIEGFTSPRAQEYYNLKLGARRASSVSNYILSYQGGAFQSYFRSGQLQFVPVSYGETRVKPGVSDALDDERLSIYAVDAASERRAEINEVEVITVK